MAAIAAPYIDLTRIARSLDALAVETSFVLRGPTYDNLLHVIGGEKFAISHVLDGVGAHPEAFHGAIDVTRGQALLAQSLSLVSDAHVAAERAAKVGLFGRDVTKATSLLKQAASDLRDGHALLGGTRPLPELEGLVSGQRIASPKVMPTTDPRVPGQEFRKAQGRFRSVLDHVFSPLLGQRVTGRENIPQTGALLITPNHGAFLDVLDIIRTVGPVRSPRGMGAEKAFVPGLKTLMHDIGIFPVKRGAPEEALQLSRGILKSGDADLARASTGGSLVVYPEGWRVLSDANASDRYGAAQIALETNAKVLAIGNYGQKPARFRGEPTFGRRLVSTHIGTPFDTGNAPASQFNIEVVTERISREKEALTWSAKNEYLERRAAAIRHRPIVGAGLLAAGAGTYAIHDAATS